jgi:uncharacterized coiled-coil DUF342 family protein|tara:strand:+ start:292 stop:516 length:225 start_codon:yes stop_codon:yes gene_type:complete
MEELLNTRIRKRSEDLTGDWTPFVNNIEDILSEIKEIRESIDDLDNKIGETTGMVKNLRKILIKLEVIDDRFIF